jgi:hypothetical protein
VRNKFHYATPFNNSRRNHNKNNNNRNKRNNNITNNSMTRFRRGPGLQGVKYACVRCKKDNHTAAECSFKESATSHIAHQVQVQVAADLAHYIPTYSEIKQSGDVEQYTTIL